jgi:hypothetical protein
MLPMRGKAIFTVALSGVCLWGCKTITEELPTRSTANNPTITVPFPVLVTPVAIPQPETTTTTTAPAGGNPAPNPTPTPNGAPPASQSCAPAPAPGNERCPREGASDFLGAVESAYDSLIAKNPGWFSGSGGARTVKLSEHDWSWAVINELRRKGYCAGMYAEEISVRTSRAYSENFDVLTSSSTIRRGEGAYRSTCKPASTTEE